MPFVDFVCYKVKILAIITKEHVYLNLHIIATECV